MYVKDEKLFHRLFKEFSTHFLDDIEKFKVLMQQHRQHDEAHDLKKELN